MADEITTGASTPDPGSAGAAAPSPVTLADDSQFIPPGGKDPVTYKDFISGYVPKDELTRMRQKDAAERQTWQQTERQRLEQELRQQYDQQQRQQTQTQQGDRQRGEWLNELRSRPYLSGSDAAVMMEQTVIPLANALLQQRQEAAAAITLLQQQVQKMQQSVGGFTSEYQQNKLSSLMQTTKTKLGLPDQPIVDELLQDVYHSHQGWDSDPQAFETTVSTRWRDLQAAIRALDKQKAEEARRQIPAQKPGMVRPGQKPVTGGETPEQLAERLWTGLQSVNT